MGGESLTDMLNALLTKPEERSDRAREVLARQPLMASHPIVAGTTPQFVPHRPERPEKSQGGVPFKIVSEYSPKGDQPQAIKELVEGVIETRAQPSAARRHRLGQDVHGRPRHRSRRNARR